MSTQRERLLAASRHGASVRYHEFKTLLEHFGFGLVSMNRLHQVFAHPQLKELLSLQNVNGQIKPFQVKQAIALIYKYQLKADDEA